MRSTKNVIEDLRKIAGVDNINFGLQEAYLLKLNKAKINSNGWYIHIIETGEEKWAYNSFDWGEGGYPEGTVSGNIVSFPGKLKVYALKQSNEVDWRIIQIDSDITNLEPGEKVLRVGDSEIRIKKDRIDINTPELYVNGSKIS